MRKTFEIPLDIPQVTVEQVETDSHGDFVITVKSTVEGTHCHQCGKKITKVYGLTGCKFSVARMLCSSAQIEGNRIRRERCAEKNAWDSEPA